MIPGRTVIVFSPRYHIDIGLHVFPTEKYQRVAQRLQRDTREPEPASWEQLALVHTAEYLDKMRHGRMTPQDLAQLELPWSSEMVDGFRLMVGGTILAARLASGRGSVKSEVRSDQTSDFPAQTSAFPLPTSPIAIHVGGGFHHAFPHHGEGFCAFHDVAVAVRVLQSEGVSRHAIIDLDVH